MLKNIAVLIDADNVSSQKINWIFDKIDTLGTITTKRIYGDFTKPHLSSWENAILKYDGYSEFKKVTQYLNANYPMMKTSNYGYAKWRSLLNQLDFFEIKTINEVLYIRTKTPYLKPIEQSSPKTKYISKHLKYKIMKMIDKAPIKDEYGYTSLEYIESQLKIMNINIADYNCKDIKSFLRKVGCILKD